MDKVLQPVTITSESCHEEAIDPLVEYQQWYMRMKQLVREADYAKANGELQKVQVLQIEISIMTKDYSEKRVLR